MAIITTQKQLQAVRSLPFCHVCGRTFDETEHVDHDHIPPQACFDKSDRNPPLKLKTHVACNNVNKLNDEKVGQLVAAQRHKILDPTATRLKVKVLEHEGTGSRFAAIENLDVDGAIRRWVGGFHAALYQRPLQREAIYSVTSPLPRARMSGTEVAVDPVRPQHALFVRTLKLNRAASNLDILVTNAGRLRYECVWVPEDSGSLWFCIFALNLYDWISLGDGQNFEPRGCVGVYLSSREDVPPSATRATKLEAPVKNKAPLDPFGP